MSINEIQDDIIEEFSLFGDWMEKYEYLIDLGKTLPLIDPDLKTDNRLIKGCQSQVWLAVEEENGKLIFTADSDAIITKGLIALLIRVFSHQTPEEIASADLYFIEKIGLKEHLSSTRSNGLVSMIQQIKTFAASFLKKEHL